MCCSVAQAILELAIFIPQAPKCWGHRCASSHPVGGPFQCQGKALQKCLSCEATARPPGVLLQGCTVLLFDLTTLDWRDNLALPFLALWLAPTQVAQNNRQPAVKCSTWNTVQWPRVTYVFTAADILFLCLSLPVMKMDS